MRKLGITHASALLSNLNVVLNIIMIYAPGLRHIGFLPAGANAVKIDATKCMIVPR